MGYYSIIVSGCGPHHNEGNDAGDSNKHAKDLVETLKEKGHDVSFASIFYGGDKRDDLL